MNLRVLTDSTTEPFYNIALEHALHTKVSSGKGDPIVRFWKNTQSVIIGRIQDIEKEVNLTFCRENEIPIIRRISGGGTVYHDLGNLNTSIMLPISHIPTKKDVQSFSVYFTELIKNTLEAIGLDTVSRKADTNVFYQDLKVSGSAGHLRQGWFLHHATLLLSSDIDTLNKTLRARESHPEDPKASRYYPTNNLEMIEEKQWQEAFISQLLNSIEYDPYTSNITEDEKNYAIKLQQGMYEQSDWIYEGKRRLIKPDNSK